jgi:hypothetical protein
MGLAAMGRAKNRKGAGAAADWLAAREWLLSARRDRDRLLAQAGPWSFSREETETLGQAIAECDQSPATK